MHESYAAGVSGIEEKLTVIKHEKYKPTNIGQITLERQAGQFILGILAYINFCLWVQKFRPLRDSNVELRSSRKKHRTLGYPVLVISYLTIVFILATNFEVRAISGHSKMKKTSVKKRKSKK